MKTIRTIVIWSLAAIVLQLSGLYFLNNYYWKPQTSFKIIPVTKTKTVTKKSINIKVPASASNIKVSYDGKYIAYTLDGEITVVDTTTNENKTVEFPNGASISYYRWLPDRNRLYIAEKYTKKHGAYILFSGYEPRNGIRQEMVYHNQPSKLTLPDKYYNVDKIAIATATSVNYIGVSRPGYGSRIYYMNVMNTITQLRSLKSYNIKDNDIQVLNMEDKLIYGDPIKGKVYACSGEKGYSEQIKIKDVTPLSLLGVDINDNIYIGKVVEGKIVSIYYGTEDTDTSTWKIINLSQPVDKTYINITREGKILIDYVDKNQIFDALNNKSTDYQGEPLSIIDKGIALINNLDYKLVNYAK